MPSKNFTICKALRIGITLRLFSAALLTSCLTSSLALAVTTTWTDGNGGSWTDSGNWSNGAAGPFDFAIFPVDADAVTLPANRSVLEMRVGSLQLPGVAQLALDLQGNSLTVSNDLQLGVRKNGILLNRGDAELTLSGGGTLAVLGTLNLGDITGGGSLNSEGELFVTNNSRVFAGTLDVDRGRVEVSDGGEVEAINVYSTGHSGVRLNSGGHLIADYLLIDSNDGTAGFLVADGGTANIDSLEVLSGYLRMTDSTLASDSIVINTGGLTGTTGKFTQQGGSLTTSGSVKVGTTGFALLYVEDDASFNTGSLQVAVEPGSTGEATIDGNSTTANMTDVFYVGYQGNGTATISGGATVEGDKSLRVGLSPGGVGELTVDGSDSSLEVDQIASIGDFGEGTLRIRNGAEFKTLSTLVIGERRAEAVGTVEISDTGSSVDATGGVKVGNLGHGSLDINQGGAVATATLQVAVEPGSSGTATIDGTDTTVNMTDVFYVGYQGNGTATISGGATVAGDKTLRVGLSPGGVGELTLDGTNSSLEVDQLASIGDFGDGTLRIRNGARFKTLSTLVLGERRTEAIGAAVFSENSSVEASLNVVVGDAGSGSLTISDTVTLSTPKALVLGIEAGSSGDVMISGGTVTLGEAVNPVGANMTIGSEGTGTYTQTGGEVSVGNDIRIGRAESGNGTLNLLGGTIDVAQNVYAGGQVGFDGGVGSLTVGGTNPSLNVAGTLKIYDQGTVTVESGNVKVGAIDATEGQFDFTGGRLVTGQFIGDLSHEGAILIANQFDGNLTVNGGTLVISDFPSEDPISMMDVDGAILHQDGAIFFDLGGTAAGEFDTLHTTGLLALSEDDSRMVVNTVNGFEVGVGDVFEIISADGGVTGDFSRLRSNNTDFIGALEFELIYEPNSVSLVAVPILDGDFNADGEVNGSDFLTWQRNPSIGDLTDWQANYGTQLSALAEAAASVPEPSTLLLLAIGILFNSKRSRIHSRTHVRR